MSDPRLTAYVLGELDGAEKAEVERMLQASPALEREVEKIRRMTLRLREELRAPPAQPAGTFSGWRAILVIALGLGIGAALANWVFMPAPPKEPELMRTAHVQLDPPVNTNSELATDVWSLTALKDGLTVGKGMDQEGILATVQKGLPGVRNCYEARAPREAQPSPNELFEWSVRDDGSYAEGGPLNGAFDKALAGCLRTALKTWQFPKGKAGKIQMSFAIQKRR